VLVECGLHFVGETEYERCDNDFQVTRKS